MIAEGLEAGSAALFGRSRTHHRAQREAGAGADGPPIRHVEAVRREVSHEALGSCAFLTESATVVFGGIAEGDLWTASRTRWPDGRWFEIEEEGTPADGPLIRQEGSAVAVEAEFERASDGSRRAGSLQAVCPE